jgi:tetratricopeptide (TPR) repeat protein
VGHAFLTEALEVYQELGDAAGLADVHWGLGNLALFAADDPAEAVTHFEESIAGYTKAGNVFGEGWAHFELGESFRRHGDPATARPHYVRGLELLYGTGDVSATVLFVMAFAALALDTGDEMRAFRLAGAAFAAADRSGIDLISVSASRIEGMERETLEAVTDERADAYREGAAMSYDQAVDYALGSG